MKTNVYIVFVLLLAATVLAMERAPMNQNSLHAQELQRLESGLATLSPQRPQVTNKGARRTPYLHLFKFRREHKVTPKGRRTPFLHLQKFRREHTTRVKARRTPFHLKEILALLEALQTVRNRH